MVRIDETISDKNVDSGDHRGIEIKFYISNFEKLKFSIRMFKQLKSRSILQLVWMEFLWLTKVKSASKLPVSNLA